LIRLLLTESVLLAVLGGLAGLVLSILLPPILLSIIPETGLDVDFKPNATVFAYMFLVSLITGVVFGLAPAIESTKTDLISALKSRGQMRISLPRLRNLLVIGQVAVSLVLLIGAGLLVSGLLRAQSTDVGFDQKNLVVVSMDLSTQGYDEARKASLNAQLSERLKSLPGIKSVSIAEVVPFTGRRDVPIEVEGYGSSLSVGENVVSPEYFQTLGIPMRNGRQFTEEDARNGESTAVISEAMANRFWSNVNPIGQRFKDYDGASHEVIGVVADISSRQVGRIDGPVFYRPALFSTIRGSGWPPLNAPHSFLVRTNENQRGVISAVREVMLSLDKDVSVSVEPLEENVRRMLEPARMAASFSGSISLLALLIAATGIYGMLSYHVVERTSEIGIRMALGAQRRNVLLLIVGDGMKLAAVGTAIGVVGAIVLTKLMSTMLFGIAGTDAVTFAAVSLGSLAVALLACYVPARRATKVDPMVALRNE